MDVFQQQLSNNLVGGFTIFSSIWIIPPGRGENEKYLKPPPSNM